MLFDVGFKVAAEAPDRGRAGVDGDTKFGGCGCDVEIRGGPGVEEGFENLEACSFALGVLGALLEGCDGSSEGGSGPILFEGEAGGISGF